MKLGIISDAHHYYDHDGRLCVLTPVARQFEQWAALFDDVTVCAPLLPGPPPATHSPYGAHHIGLLPVRPAGGNSIAAKLRLLATTRQWWVSLQALLATVDAVHIRCPNNISILGLLALRRSAVLRQAVYTGNWNSYPGEPITYRWQRRYLQQHFGGPVAVYGQWPDQPAHIVTTFSPSYSLADWEAESASVADKIQRMRRRPVGTEVVHLVSVGALNKNKNQQFAIRVVKEMEKLGVAATLDIVGAGSEEEALVALSEALGLRARIHLRGRKGESDVKQAYRDADFVIQPSFTEGYSKVPLEACFYATIPLLSDININPDFVGGGRRGLCFSLDDPAVAAREIVAIASRPETMVKLMENCREYAREHSLEAWRLHISEILQSHWGEAASLTHAASSGEAGFVAR